MCIGYKNLPQLGIRHCAFENDMVLLANSKKNVENLINAWNSELTECITKLNECNSDSRAHKISKHWYKRRKLEHVKKFKYLGPFIEDTGNIEIEINQRIDNAERLYHASNKKFLSKKEVTKETKLIAFKIVYRSVLTFGCKPWILTYR